jgi:trans-2,3-dihydro-3-hydroxyanthranilate isomerase
MTNIDYYIVDVFAKNKYEGNQLAVFVDMNNELPDEAMQQMTREINFAESAFIKKDNGNGRFVVRIFTPEYELPFAGHPCLGTAYIISRFLLPQARNKLVLELLHSPIEITLADPQQADKSIFFMRQTQPVFGDLFTKEEITQSLGLNPGDLHPALPIEEVNTGIPYILIPLNSLQAIENLSLRYESLKAFLLSRKKHKSNSKDGRSTSLFFFTSQTYGAASNYNTRMLLIENDKLSEDAATGSANGCLLAYLLKHETPQVKAVVEQGFQMGRKSYIYLEGSRQNDNYQIEVGGHCQFISQGKWYV